MNKILKLRPQPQPPNPQIPPIESHSLIPPPWTGTGLAALINEYNKADGLFWFWFFFNFIAFLKIYLFIYLFLNFF